jgi:hypothetical protein
MDLWPMSGYHPGLPPKEASMTTKRYPKKRPAKSGKDDPVPVRGPWPDPRSREEISHGDAESDAGKHVKNPDWERKW